MSLSPRVNWRKISISLIDPEFGEEKAQSCACQHLVSAWRLALPFPACTATPEAAPTFAVFKGWCISNACAMFIDHRQPSRAQLSCSHAEGPASLLPYRTPALLSPLVVIIGVRSSVAFAVAILFLQILEQVRLRYSFVAVGYVIMPEHVHLLISEPDRGTQSTVMQVLKQRFARRLLGEWRRQRKPQQCEFMAGGARSRSRMASALLRLHRSDGDQEAREVAVYASQSGSSGIGAGARPVAVEQLPVVCSRRTRAGFGERTTTC